VRIASGVTDQYIYFVAVDATDFATRETGLSSFTVYRSRNGGTAAAMTTPTINETDATNMPGVYELLLDEDMTIDSGDETQEMAFHITHAGMAPVTRTIELYRPKITAGNTLDVTSTGAAGIDWGNVENQSTSVDLSSTAINLCDTVTTNTDMRGTDSAILASSAPTNFGDLAITVTTGQITVGTNNDKTGYSISGTITTLDGLPTVAGISDGVWDEVLSGHLTAGTTGNALNAAGAAGDPWSTAIPGAYGAGTAGYIVGNNLDAPVSTVDTVVDGIKAVTDNLPDSGALTSIAQASALSTVSTNVSSVLTDTGTTLPAQIAGLNDPTAAAIADAVWDEAQSGHVGAGTFGEIATEIAAILVDTAEIGAAGAGLTAVPWNASWDAEVQSECTDAITAASLATAANLATVDTVVDAIKVVTDAIPDAGALTSISTAITTVDTVVDGIKAKTDSLTFTTAGQVDSNIQSINDVAITGNGQTGTEFGV
jgi:hypothetical protein